MGGGGTVSHNMQKEILFYCFVGLRCVLISIDTSVNMQSIHVVDLNNKKTTYFKNQTARYYMDRQNLQKISNRITNKNK